MQKSFDSPSKLMNQSVNEDDIENVMYVAIQC